MNLYERLVNWIHPEVAKEVADLEARIAVLEGLVAKEVEKIPEMVDGNPTSLPLAL